MNKKGKGSCAERELVHKFWATGSWAAHRIAGSGSSKYPSPDIIASNNIRRLAIECKSCSAKSVYIPKREIEELKRFGVMFGAEPWVGVKFSRLPWMFMSLDDMIETDASFATNIENSKAKGLLFDEIIEL